MCKYSERRDEYLAHNKVVILSPQKKEMLVKKILVFNELINKLVEWKKETENQAEDEVLRDLSFVPLMKCLYIVCLLSVHKNVDISLFDTYNNFKAYDKGPVDEDCYYRISDLPDFTIDPETETIIKRANKDMPDFCEKFGITEERYRQIFDDLGSEGINQILEKAIEDLKGAYCFPGFREKDALIDMTHRELWERARETNDKKLLTGNKNALLKEAREIRGVIAA